MRNTSRGLLVVAITSVSIAASSAVQSQEDTASTSVPSAASINKAQRKAQRKAARKQAHAKRDTELEKLKGAGYNPPAGNDENYPHDLQSAEKRAAKPGAASQ